jgi:hypothetical protein
MKKQTKRNHEKKFGKAIHILITRYDFAMMGKIFLRAKWHIRIV